MRPNAVFVLWVLLMVSLFSNAAHSADREERLRNLSEKLIALRGEVDDLNSRLNLARQQHAQDMQGLASRKNNMQSRIEQEQLSIEKLRSVLEQNRKRALEAGADSGVLKPVLLEAVSGLETHIRRSLPFRTVDRLAVLDEYRSKLEAGVLAPQKAANQLWSYMEDEIRLTRENGLYRQTIELDGKEQLVDVARLGMVLMYFRSGDGNYGLFEKENDRWVVSPVSDSSAQGQIESLFSALEKQVRTGYFELPNPL